MKLKEALVFMKKGHKIRIKSWDEGKYIDSSTANSSTLLKNKDLVSEDWEVIKKINKYYAYINIQDRGNFWCSSMVYSQSPVGPENMFGDEFKRVPSHDFEIWE